MINLNPEQKAMVVSEGNLVVTACPGSGKTRALISKLSYELERIEDVKRKIIALTFTNRAAEEIQKRLDVMNIDMEKLWTGTIHAFCLEWILRPYALYIDRLKNGFTVLDEFRQEKILNGLKEQSNLPRYENIALKWSKEGSSKQNTPIKQYIANQYHNWLLENKCIDFDLILFLSYSLLQERPQISKSLSRLFKLICIDEYQDTSELQYGIIGSIVKTGNGETNIVMVGDPDQAIYDTLGGVAKSVEEISMEIGGLPVKHLKLSGNYRSSQRVIDFYKNFQLTNIKIQAIGKNANSKAVVTFNNSISESNLVETIAQIIKSNIRRGIPANEICVIAPQWWLLISMARSLKAMMPGIKFDAPGLSPLPKSYDNFWFKVARIFLTTPSPTLFISRRRWADDIINDLKSITGFTDIIINNEMLTSKILLDFCNLTSKTLKNEIDGLVYLDSCFNSLLKFVSINLLSHTLLNDHYSSFFKGIEERLARNGFDATDRLLHNFKSSFQQSNGVVVNTCQGVKGEEYETIIAFGLLQGYVPHASIRNPMQAEMSSKRLLYVIGSRAKTNLHLIAENRNNKNINKELSNVEFAYDDYL
ncbi:ATP-dependent helicase [Paenibacillus sp. FSL R10-2736]|uniref:ATP-dependent helicase n=1 Tax=Paenibacillus sp. FSL R10-2736 TaxID=2954692 RepID=UPI0030F921F8